MTTKYVIRQTRNFYNLNPVRNLVTDDNYKPLIFNTASEARAYIAEMESEVYYTAHNESGRPDYRVLNSANLPAYLTNQF